ncbi:uncharacterized protein LOC133310077 [Gastrolobium bilobum]|uniref:uncharacterized protein LOC133310077 n=1 Tax=Gastrolobium bilobum TaxID=150636 RepID=UPI002AB2C6F6|nr:uncharacterized protein LOC133310077 [Gastrolobium bilobum]
MASASTNLINPTASIPMHADKPENLIGEISSVGNRRHTPKLDEGEQLDKEKVAAINAWKHSDFLCRNYIVNGLDDTLYNVYSTLKTNFKNYLNHKRKELPHEDLIMRLRIEEDNKIFEKKNGNSPMVSKANIVEEGSRSKKQKYFEEGNAKQGKGKKFKGYYYNCGNFGHRARDCKKKQKKDQKKPQKFKKKKTTEANMVDIAEKVEDLNLAAVVMECNLVGDIKKW